MASPGRRTRTSRVASSHGLAHKDGLSLSHSEWLSTTPRPSDAHFPHGVKTKRLYDNRRRVRFFFGGGGGSGSAKALQAAATPKNNEGKANGEDADGTETTADG